MNLISLLADRNSPTNVWLRENPMVLSAGMALLGIVLLYYGVLGLKTGTTRDKYGNEMTGGLAALGSIARTIAGVGLIGAAIYVALFGAW